MARNKYPEITEKRILDAALKLFMEKGYEQTTIQDIVNELGDLSKGAVYHHFKSKEDIVDAVTTRVSMESNPFDRVQEMKELNGLQKIRQTFLLSLANQKQWEMYHLFPSLLKNPKFLAQTVQDSVQLAHLLERMIEEGNKDGSLSIPYPKQTAEAILLLVNVWINPAAFPVSRKEFMQKLAFLEDMLEKLGLPIVDDELRKVAQNFCVNILPE